MRNNVKIVSNGVELYSSNSKTVFKDDFITKLNKATQSNKLIIMRTLYFNTLFNILTSFNRCKLDYMELYKIVEDFIDEYMIQYTYTNEKPMKEVFTFKTLTLLESLSKCNMIQGSVEYATPINNLFKEIDRLIG